MLSRRDQYDDLHRHAVEALIPVHPGWVTGRIENRRSMRTMDGMSRAWRIAADPISTANRPSRVQARSLRVRRGVAFGFGANLGREASQLFPVDDEISHPLGGSQSMVGAYRNPALGNRGAAGARRGASCHVHNGESGWRREGWRGMAVSRRGGGWMAREGCVGGSFRSAKRVERHELDELNEFAEGGVN